MITHRVLHLIRDLGIDGASILVISFSRASALEMKERFLRLSGESQSPVSFGTFHALFFQILKKEYAFHASDLLDQKEKLDFLYEALSAALRKASVRKESGEDPFSRLWLLKQSLPEKGEQKDELLSDVLRLFGKEKNLSRSATADEIPAPLDIASYRLLKNHYEKIVSIRHKLDFDDMLRRGVDLLKKRPDILLQYQNRYRFILIDEFQDINPVQFEGIRMIAAPENNLFVVGDDDQSIYGFRGSTPDIMLHFKDYYPDAEQILLNRNYRNPADVVELSGRMIGENSGRYEKDIRSAGKETQGLCFVPYSDEKEQYTRILQEIRTLSSRIPYEEMAVLFRRGADKEDLLEYLEKEGIPYEDKEKEEKKSSPFWEEDLKNYIRYVQGDYSREIFLKIMNKPYRYIYRDMLFKQSYPPDNTLLRTFPMGDARGQKRFMALEQFIRDIAVLKRLSPFLFCDYVRKTVGYDHYLKQLEKDGKMPGGIRYSRVIKELNRLQEHLKGFQSPEEWINAPAMSPENVVSHGIRIMTYHASKGLEFDAVFLPHLKEGSIPHPFALTDSEKEEERRMLYVAMTRAKKKLYLLYADTAPSRFLKPIL